MASESETKLRRANPEVSVVYNAGKGTLITTPQSTFRILTGAEIYHGYARMDWVSFTNLHANSVRNTLMPDRKSTRLNSSHSQQSRMPSSA